MLAMEFPSVSFSTEEAIAAQPSTDNVEASVRLFAEHGAVRLLNVFSEGFRARLREHYMSRYRLEMEATRQADKRPLFTVDVEGPVAEEAYLVNGLLAPILERLLGEDFVLGAVSTVISFPGAPQQFVHRDSPSLYGDYSIDSMLPAYALTTLIPMVDANAETGSTRVWLGSHRLADADKRETRPSASPDVPFGSMLMTDSRVLHCGSPNQSERVRPLLYNTYHRNWFRDYSGYERRQAVSISGKARALMPAHLRRRFRIADEANGQPEGPLPFPGLLANALPGGLQKLVVGRRSI